MEIYFDGCSRTYGGELEEEHRESQRFSRVFCEKIGARDHNKSQPGASNERILRNLFVENNICEYDFAVIQMSYPSRTEYYDMLKSKFYQVQPNKTFLLKRSKKEDRQFWQHYYKNIYTDFQGVQKEKIVYQSIKDHCKVNNVPLILITNNNWSTDLEFDISLELEKYPTLKGGHPTPEGHRMIADDIYDLFVYRITRQLIADDIHNMIINRFTHTDENIF
mgnify:FL=1|tara:strand:+ start:240 stop:902 length:663 start_codon:yes stop_codon:yes gene_type:complete